ncbi:glycosyltransferase, partial [Cetobacterium sp.]
MEPLVSIITPSYNSKDFIGETIESVLNQTYKN